MKGDSWGRIFILDVLYVYKWSSLLGYVVLPSRLKFVEYYIVLAEHGGDTLGGRSRYQKQIVEDLTGGLTILKKLSARASWGVRVLYLGSEKVSFRGP